MSVDIDLWIRGPDRTPGSITPPQAWAAAGGLPSSILQHALNLEHPTDGPSVQGSHELTGRGSEGGRGWHPVMSGGLTGGPG